MEAQVAQAMEEGAFGLSTSLLYVPDRFASTGEIIALARVARRYGGTYITHQRDEGNCIVKSLEEVFRIAREAGIPAEIYHLKTAGRQNWGRMPEVLKRIEKARAEGLEITANMYPWIASSNSLHASLPAWAREGASEAMVARLKDPKLRERARAELREDWGRSDGSHILIADALDPALAKYEGRNLAEIARSRTPGPDRRAHGHRHRGQRQHRQDQLHHERGRHPDRDPAPAGVDAAPTRALPPPTASSPRSATIPRGWGTTAAHPRQVRPQGEADPAGRGGAEDDLAARRRG